jgi:hypothetical protein
MKNRVIILVLTLTSSLLGGVSTAAQEAPVSVRVSLDTASIMIGDQLGLNVQIAAPTGTRIQQIQFGEWEKAGKVEIMDLGPLSTIAETPELLQQQRVLFTTFDSGYHRLPPLQVIYELNGIVDTARSGNLGLRVFTLPVTEDTPILANKDIVTEPLNLRDLLPYGLGILAVVLLGLGWWKWSGRKPKKATSPPPPPVPAHVLALEKLTALEQAASWQHGEAKAFQSELTYILREYLENRYQVHALEATTPEILVQLRTIAAVPDHTAEIKSILETADLVKFAKAVPPLEVHPRALAAVRDFVMATQALPVEEEPATTANDKETTP